MLASAWSRVMMPSCSPTICVVSLAHIVGARVISEPLFLFLMVTSLSGSMEKEGECEMVVN